MSRMKRRIDAHVRGFETMHPRLQRAMVTMIKRAYKWANEKKKPHPRKANND